MRSAPSLTACLEAIDNLQSFASPATRAAARRLIAAEQGISLANLSHLERIWLEVAA